MKNGKPNKRLSKKEKAKLERDQEKAKLLENYIEGESNIDYDKLETDDIWKLFDTDGLSIEEKEKRIDKPLPLLAREEWLERELAKINAKRPKEPPAFKVQNPFDVESKYHQKFVEKITEYKPQIIEDLRELTSNFEALFTNKIEKDYLAIVRDLMGKLLWQRRIYPFPENHPINQSYIWGELQNAFFWAQKYYLSKHLNYKFDSEVDDGVIEDNKYTLQIIEAEIKTAFKQTAQNEDSILPNFFILQGKIYEWAEKYHLKEDWLIDYAYYFIEQLSRNKGIPVNEIKVANRHYSSSTMYYDFEFKSRGWWASGEGESAPEYKARVTKEFEKQLNDYLSEATYRLGLDKLKKVTKSPTYESVDWLVYSIVKDCDGERLVEKFYPDIAADKTKNKLTKRAFESKKKHIENEIRKLKIYGLPQNEKI